MMLPILISEVKVGDKFDFSYRDSMQTFKVPKTGFYSVELWGGQSYELYYHHSGYNTIPVSRGAYTYGEIELKEGEEIYVYTGEMGYHGIGEVSFNGGGYGGTLSGITGCIPCRTIGIQGAGATDIRLVGGEWDNFESLKSRIMVAAGAGGGSSNTGGKGHSSAGALEGFPGEYGEAQGPLSAGQGGTQTAGGAAGFNSDGSTGSVEAGSFGRGGSSDAVSELCASGGGGSGYFGGGAGGGTMGPDGYGQGGGGGSSFISGYEGCRAIAENSTAEAIYFLPGNVHYSGRAFRNGKMLSGQDMVPKQSGGGKSFGNTNHGFARFKYLGTS